MVDLLSALSLAGALNCADVTPDTFLPCFAFIFFATRFIGFSSYLSFFQVYKYALLQKTSAESIPQPVGLCACNIGVPSYLIVSDRHLFAKLE